MPRKKTTCARTPGHGGHCKTAESMERNRLYNRDHPHRESPESRKKSNRKYRISSYGLTYVQFDRLLDSQQYSCGMCREPFKDGQLIHVDHDHACCKEKIRSCGQCVRGLPHLQHRARPHRAQVCDGSCLPGRPSDVSDPYASPGILEGGVWGCPALTDRADGLSGYLLQVVLSG
jgi:hypothetical protein